MNKKRKFPDIIKQVGFDFPFDFENDSKKIWVLRLPVVTIPTKILEWHLKIPFWSSENGFYDLSPNELMRHQGLSPFHYRKVMDADLNYPIDYTFYKGRYKIIDGLHRLTKAVSTDQKEILARFLTQELLLETIKHN